MNKRAQAALEFLTTYGWAILVILVMIGALVYFGLLNPNRALPNRCEVTTGIACKDFLITSDGFEIIMYNKMGDSIKSVNVTSVESNEFIGSLTLASDCQIEGIVPADAEMRLNCSSTGLFAGLGGSGQNKVKIAFDITYIPIRGTYSKTASGTIYGPVQ
ncbi:hypothetical protein JW826_00120 [Candidatus Woesearchaeota archaeon]|nr:hypothetical protein [Candidatus Woesearchaeota archaeon]